MEKLSLPSVDGFEFKVCTEEGSGIEKCVITKYTGTSDTVIIPDKINGITVKNIGGEAFTENDIIKNVTIPNSVTEMENGFYALHHTAYRHGVFEYCTKLTSVILSENLSRISGFAFSGCESLKNIIIPDNVKYIGEAAFSVCTSLENIVIPDGVMFIGDSAFNRCTALTEILIPNSVTKIDAAAFLGCSSLTSVFIPVNVAIIRNIVFLHCENLVNINVDTENTAFSDEDGILFNKDKTVFMWYPEARKQNKYIIPNGVTVIDHEAFHGCKNLENISLPEGLTKIGICAFKDCENLTGIAIPDSVTDIEYEVFDGCKSLKTITIPSGAHPVNWSMRFGGCEKLENIFVDAGNMFMSDEDGVLFNKDKSFLIRYPAGKKQESYTIPESVTEIYDGAFIGCKSLTIHAKPGSAVYGYAERYNKMAEG